MHTPSWDYLGLVVANECSLLIHWWLSLSVFIAGIIDSFVNFERLTVTGFDRYLNCFFFLKLLVPESWKTIDSSSNAHFLRKTMWSLLSARLCIRLYLSLPRGTECRVQGCILGWHCILQVSMLVAPVWRSALALYMRRTVSASQKTWKAHEGSSWQSHRRQMWGCGRE